MAGAVGGTAALALVWLRAPAAPLVGTLLLVALVVMWPSSSRRWAAGAAGERATAAALEGVEREGYLLLHDVRLPGQRWNFDHVLLGPAGVVVVESKQWRRRVTVGRRRPRIFEDRMGWQLDALAAALDDDGVSVHGFLCIHGATVRRRRWTGARWAPVGDGRHLRRWLRRLPSGRNGQMCQMVFEGRGGWG